MKHEAPNRERYQQFFLASSAILLIVTGLSKLFSLVSSTPDLEFPDPIFLLPTRILIVGAAGIEWMMAWRLYTQRNRPEAIRELAVLTVLFAIYRVGLALIGDTRVCPCVGVLGYIGFIPRKLIVALGDGMFFYILGGCMITLSSARLFANAPAASVKLSSLQGNSDTQRITTPTIREKLLLLIPVVFVVCLLIPRLWVFVIHGDEGYNLIKAALTLQGFPLYERTWSDQPPLLSYLLGAVFSISGSSVIVGRILAIAVASLLVWALGRLVWQERGVMASIFSSLFLILSPYFFTLSSSVLVGPVSLGFVVFSIYILLNKDGTQSLIRCFLSGAVFAVALQTKLDVILLLPAVIYYLTAASKDNARMDHSHYRGAALSVWLVGTLSMFLFFGVILGWDAAMLLDNHIGSRIYTSFADRPGWPRMFTMLLEEWVVILPALVGIWHAMRKGDRHSRFPVVWLVTEIIVRAWYRPFWEYHYEHLAVPLAWLGGIGVNEMLRQTGYFSSHSMMSRLRAVEAGGFICLSIWSAGTIVGTAGRISDEIGSTLHQPSHFDSEWAVVDRMKQFSTETHWVFTDHPIYAFRAGLPVPPETAVLSRKRFASGQMTEIELRRLVSYYEPEQIVITSSWAAKILGEYVKNGYTLVDETDLSRHWVSDKIVGKR